MYKFVLKHKRAHIMEKSKLIEVLKTLSKAEVKEFGKYLEKNAYRKANSISIYSLFNYLKKYYPDFPAKKIEKEYVYKKLAKDSTNASKRMLDLMSNLYQVLEDFLIKKELEENQINRNFLVLDILKKRKLDKLFFQKVGQVQKDWGKKTPAGIEQFHNEYKLAKTCFMHPNYSLFPGQDIDPNVLLDKMDKYYFAVKLYYNLCVEITSYSLNNEAKETYKRLIVGILKECEEEEMTQTPQLNLFNKLLQAYQNKNFDNYKECKTDFINSIELYEASETHDLFLLLQNAAYTNYRNGKTEYLREMFELNKIALEYGLFIESGYISEFTFKNLVVIACSLDELEWTENFINDFQGYLNEEIKEDIVQLCKAILSFNKGDFEDSLQGIAMVHLPDAVYGVQLRELQLQCYYELEDYEELFFNLVKSFSAYLNRNDKLAKPYKDSCQNFIKYLYKLKVTLDKDKRKALQEEIINHKNINHKSWLLQK